MDFEKEIGHALPANFQDKVNAYKDSPLSEEMLQAFKRLAAGDIPLTIDSAQLPRDPKSVGALFDSKPLSDDMKIALKGIAEDIAKGNTDATMSSCIHLNKYFGDGWTPEVYQKFLEAIESQ